MCKAGVLPEEIAIKKQIDVHLRKLQQMSDAADRKAALAELALLEMRYNIAREARQKFLRR